ncbi:MAG: acyltransferase family protein [Candidatus Electrothrix communis]|nr:MAG: acyltransferase family protein [Candidatus Electrothrix communis]
MNEKSRKIYIDYLRAAATVAVIFIHSTSGWYGQVENIDAVSWWVANIFNAAARFSVPVFVMASGAVLLGKTITIGDFYRKRAIRLLPPIIFWSALYTLFRIYKGMDKESLMHFLTIGIWSEGSAYFHLWYLSMFFCLMLFVPYINNVVTGKKTTRKEFTVFILLASIFFLLNTVSDLAREISNIYMYWHLLFQWYIVYFIGGYFLDKYGKSFSFGKRALVFVIVILVAVGSLGNFLIVERFHIIKDYLFLNDKGIVSLLLSFSVFLFFRRYTPDFCPAQIAAVSKNSFGIYLVHPLILDLLSSVFYKFSLPGYAHILLISPLTFIISYFFITIIRKNGYLRSIC